MKKLPLTLVCTLLPLFTAPTANAQSDEQEMGPAKQVAKFHRLLGNWEGKGNVMMGSGMPPTPWTSTSCCELVLGGHFVRDDTRISFAGGEPADLVFRSFYGWDGKAKRYVSFGISNEGSADSQAVHWVGDTLISAMARKQDGKLIIERWSTQFGADEDSYKIVGHQAGSKGDFRVHVEGTFKRVAADAAAKKKGRFLDAGFFMGSPDKTMNRFEGMSGNYRFKGWVIPAPGAPKMEITGTEEIASVFGGSVIEMHIKGDPIPGMGAYEGWGAIAWNKRKGCYDSLWLSNMGEGSIEEARWVGKHELVFTGATTYMGDPLVQRSVLRYGKSGKIETFSTHSINGADDPVETFGMKYELLK